MASRAVDETDLAVTAALVVMALVKQSGFGTEIDVKVCTGRDLVVGVMACVRSTGHACLRPRY